MEYISMFNEIVTIMHEDYSGCFVKKGWDNPDYFRNIIKELSEQGKMDKFVFKEIVDDYLLDFKDDHVGLYFVSGNPEGNSNGFHVRRYENKLYITEISLENGLKKGMSITALDGISISDMAKKYERELRFQPIERQTWEDIIMKCTSCTMEDLEGEVFEFNLKKYRETDMYAPKYSCQKIDEDILYLRINNFLHGNEFTEVINNNRNILDTTKYFVIDVRDNPGGNNAIGNIVLEYLFNEGDSYSGESKYIFNWTERNANSLLKSISDGLKKFPNEQMQEFYNILKSLKVPGVYDLSEYDDDIQAINGRKGPTEVVILIDSGCASSGEAFTIDASNSPKVTLMGRNTHGELDYANVIGSRIGEEFSLGYPVCYNSDVLKGKGIDNVGVAPDIYIPWTPEHIERDIDIEEAVKYLKNK